MAQREHRCFVLSAKRFVFFHSESDGCDSHSLTSLLATDGKQRHFYFDLDSSEVSAVIPWDWSSASRKIRPRMRLSVDPCDGVSEQLNKDTDGIGKSDGMDLGELKLKLFNYFFFFVFFLIYSYSYSIISFLTSISSILTMNLNIV